MFINFWFRKTYTFASSCKVTITCCKYHVGLSQTAFRYFYNYKIGRCELFGYGGCHGNGNRFLTEERCMKKCSAYMCMLPPDSGICKMNVPRWRLVRWFQFSVLGDILLYCEQYLKAVFHAAASLYGQIIVYFTNTCLQFLLQPSAKHLWEVHLRGL